MKNLGQMLKAASQMQSRIGEAKEALGALEIEGTAGAGMIRVTLSGKGDIKKMEIDPTLLKPEDVEMLQDLIVAAFADAKAKVDEAAKEKIAEITGGIQMPEGLGNMF